jgi:hypothetical protein
MHILASTDTPSYSGYLTVDGGLEVSGQTTLHDRVIVQGPFSAGGAVLHDLFVVTDVTVTHDLHVNNNLFLDNVLIAPKKAGLVMDRFVNRLGEPLEIGDVVVIGASPPTLAYGPEGMIPVPEVDLTDRVGDTRVCGVVCEVHGEITGEDGGMRRFSDAEREEGSGRFVQPGQLGHMVTLGAYAKCKVDADFAPIEAGDLLTTSPTRGHAQKVLDRAGAVGAIVGKALAPLAAGRGVIPLIVTLQ